MKSKGWISVVFIGLIVIISLFARMYYLQENMQNIVDSDALYDLAFLGSNGIQFSAIWGNGFSLRALYTSLLACGCMLFGNISASGVYINICIQTISLTLIFYIINNIINRYVSVFFTIVFSIIPLYISMILKISEINLLILIVIFAVFILSCLFCFAKDKKSDLKVIEDANTEKDNAEETVNADMGTDEGKVLKISDIILKDSNDKKLVSEEAEEEMTVIPVGMKEIKPEDLQSERHKMIDNPLPVPKKKLHKEMDYALKSTEEDDYDLKDLSDKDFFDIN